MALKQFPIIGKNPQIFRFLLEVVKLGGKS